MKLRLMIPRESLRIIWASFQPNRDLARQPSAFALLGLARPSVWRQLPLSSPRASPSPLLPPPHPDARPIAVRELDAGRLKRPLAGSHAGPDLGRSGGEGESARPDARVGACRVLGRGSGGRGEHPPRHATTGGACARSRLTPARHPSQRPAHNRAFSFARQVWTLSL
jgi:hypothetical protein